MKTIFYHRGRGGHRGYSEGSIFTHASDTDRLNVRQKKCGDFFSFLFLSSVSSCVLCGKKCDEPAIMFIFAIFLLL